MGIKMGTAIDDAVTEMNDDIMKEYRPTVLHNYNRLPVNSLAFSPNGQKLIVASDDGIMAIYKVDEDGSQEKTFENQVDPHGTCLVTYAASNIDVLFATTNGDNTIRRFDTYATKYCQTYTGNDDEIFNLVMGPGSNTFITCSKDSSVKLWDLRQEVEHLSFPSTFEKDVRGYSGGTDDPPVIAIDPESIVVAVGTRQDRCVRLYDVRNIMEGPFSTFQMWTGDPRLKVPCFGYDFQWNALSFSENGKMILINTSGPYIPVLDAFSGAEKYAIQFPMSNGNNNGIENKIQNEVPTTLKKKGASYYGLHNEAVFSPDSKYILASGDDGCVHVFDTLKGKKVTTLHHYSQRGAVESLKFNPQFMMFATGRMQTALWLPSYDGALDSETETLQAPIIVGPAKRNALQIRVNANKRVEELITRRQRTRLKEMLRKDATKDDLDKDLENYMSLRKSRPQKLIAPVKKVEVPTGAVAKTNSKPDFPLTATSEAAPLPKMSVDVVSPFEISPSQEVLPSFMVPKMVPPKKSVSTKRTLDGVAAAFVERKLDVVIVDKNKQTETSTTIIVKKAGAADDYSDAFDDGTEEELLWNKKDEEIIL